MNNNDSLIRIRYALDLKDQEMVTIFEMGGQQFTLEDVQKLLVKSMFHDEDSDKESDEDYIACDDLTLDSFLNGLITYKRGPQDSKDSSSSVKPIKENMNNVLIKKLKIALSLTSDDMHAIFEMAGITVSKSELSAVLRKVGHRNYKECGDRYVRNFLKGLTIKFRK
jgi:uncharacterized protein YehS (DUF1456 family)